MRLVQTNVGRWFPHTVTKPHTYAHDATVYGAARTSPTSYYAHHLAAISASIVTADALVVLQAAAHLAEAGPTAHGVL